MNDIAAPSGLDSWTPPAPVPTFRQTCRWIAADHHRSCVMMGAGKSFSRRLFWCLAPGFVTLALYRVTYYLYTHNMRFLSWPLYLANLYLTACDIPPSSVIGPGCFIGHAPSSVICGHVGSNATFYGPVGIGGGMRRGGTGRPDYGLPVIGDDVVIGTHGIVLGAVRIGDKVNIGPLIVVTKDMAPGMRAVSRPPMMMQAADQEPA